MKPYLNLAEAEQVMAANTGLPYPSFDTSVVDYPPISPTYMPSRGVVIQTVSPDKLILEAMPLLGNEPKHVLDAGCGSGKNALYLAMHGHVVVAMDSNETALDWARERARDLGIPNKNFIPRIGDVRDLSASDKYQAVIATMVLHYFAEADVRPVVRALHAATTSDGMNVVSAYTEDNPKEEKTKRQLRYLFKLGELASLYTNAGWALARNQEGATNNSLSRLGYAPGKEVLIPSIAEVIAKKPGSRVTSHMNANREIVYFA